MNSERSTAGRERAGRPNGAGHSSEATCAWLSRDRRSSRRRWRAFLSGIFLVGALRWKRAARIVRIARGLRSTPVILELILEKPPERLSLSATLRSPLLVVFSSIAILEMRADGANSEAGAKAAWWAVVITGTLGYGGRLPVRTDGRVLAGALVGAALGLLDTFAGFIASWFFSSARSPQGTQSELDEIRAKLATPRRGFAERQRERGN